MGYMPSIMSNWIGHFIWGVRIKYPSYAETYEINAGYEFKTWGTEF